MKLVPTDIAAVTSIALVYFRLITKHTTNLSHLLSSRFLAAYTPTASICHSRTCSPYKGSATANIIAFDVLSVYTR